MNVDIYKAIHPQDPTHRLFVFVPAGSKLDVLPDDVLTALGELRFYKSIELFAGEKRLGLRTDETIEDIKTQGFHIQRVDIRIRKSA